MKFTALTVAALVSVAVAQTSDPHIDTPNSVTECETTALTFSGSNPPFVISAIPGGQAGATPIENIVTTSTSPYPWLVNLQEGTYLTLQIRDNIGQLQYSSPVTVIAGTNSNCLNATNTAGTTIAGGSTTAGGSTSTSLPGGSTTSGGGSTTSGSGSSTSAGTSTATTKASSSSGSSSSSAPTSTTSSGAASHLDVKFGAAGVLGLIGAALMI